MGSCCSSDDAPANPLVVDLTHFRIHRVLGRGGFGKVTVTERRSDHRLFATKALSKVMLLSKAANYETCWLERKVMAQLNSPFLVNCVHAFQDPDNLYLVMPLMAGGDLRYYLNQNGTCSEADCKFYVAEIVLALEELHSLHIIYRDLKPENCLLDEAGYCRVSDFGLAYQINPNNKNNADGLTSGYCGTSGYIAPEILQKQRYSYSVDYFSLGVLIYELLHHRLPKLPFYKKLKVQYKKKQEEHAAGNNANGNNNNNNNNNDNNPANGTDASSKPLSEDGRQEELLSPGEDSDTSEIYFSSRLTPACINLITGLLTADPRQRLGCRADLDSGWSTIKHHSWFSDVNWNAMAAKKLPPPFVPNATIANCDPIYELEEQIMNSHTKPRVLTGAEQTKFIGWEFHTKLHPSGSGQYLDDHTLDYDFTIDNNNNRHFEYSTTKGPVARARDNPLDDDEAIEIEMNDRQRNRIDEEDPEYNLHGAPLAAAAAPADRLSMSASTSPYVDMAGMESAGIVNSHASPVASPRSAGAAAAFDATGGARKGRGRGRGKAGGYEEMI